MLGKNHTVWIPENKQSIIISSIEHNTPAIIEEQTVGTLAEPKENATIYVKEPQIMLPEQI